ncbi:MAG: hypothetical protein IKF93_03010 [Lachnospiraceae bacterium]|nr:hypothetical protein [Lachnospiraceae bacterium]
MKIYSPWAEIDNEGAIALNPRLDTLEGKTIGLYAHFKGHSPIMLQVVADLLQERYPTAKFKSIQLKIDTAEAVNIPEFDAELKEWLKDVDGVITAYGDMGSCCMFHAYNTAYVERLGKPTVMICHEELLAAGKKGASCRQCPNLRFVTTWLPDMSWFPVIDDKVINGMMKPAFSACLDQIIDGLTKPLTEEEKTPVIRSNAEAEPFEVDSIDGISDLFYKRGWTCGAPIVAPTEAAVENMLRGTDLPRDYVVAEIPPMNGKATVEKIAVNAVMAGCLPTYMPVLIAAVRAMTDKKIHLEGWTCSRASWFPLITVSGKVAKQIGVDSGLASYKKASTTIARAFTYIIMNISGVRPGMEDLSEPNHESRQGVCIGENEDLNPWKPLHVRFGVDENDSAVTVMWPEERAEGHGADPKEAFETMFRINYSGYDKGAAFVMTPGFAKVLYDAGLTTQDMVMDYVKEYCRQPASQVAYRWLTGSNHLPEGVVLPFDTQNGSIRKFWSTDHMLIVVVGETQGGTCITFAGGGEHGGPACCKIDLPEKWDELLAEYDDIKPTYHIY